MDLDFTVSRKCTDIIDDEGRTDHRWEVTESDGTVFYVLDDYYYSLEWVTNSLRNNRNEVRVRQYLTTADLTGFEIDDPGEEHPMAGVELTGTYCSRSELHEYANRLNRLADGCADELSILFDIKYDHPYRSIGDYEKTEADYHGAVSKSSHVDCTYTEGAMINLLLDILKEATGRDLDLQVILAEEGSQALRREAPDRTAAPRSKVPPEMPAKPPETHSIPAAEPAALPQEEVRKAAASRNEAAARTETALQEQEELPETVRKALQVFGGKIVPES